VSLQQRDGDGDGVPPGRGFPLWLVGVIIVGAVSVLFVVRNRSRIKVDFVVFDRSARIWVVILISMLLGALLAETIRLAMKRRRASKS
jgi:uncharacterized integral membrane protein